MFLYVKQNLTDPFTILYCSETSIRIVYTLHASDILKHTKYDKTLNISRQYCVCISRFLWVVLSVIAHPVIPLLPLKHLAECYKPGFKYFLKININIQQCLMSYGNKHYAALNFSSLDAFTSSASFIRIHSSDILIMCPKHLILLSQFCPAVYKFLLLSLYS